MPRYETRDKFTESMLWEAHSDSSKPVFIHIEISKN